MSRKREQEDRLLEASLEAGLVDPDELLRVTNEVAHAGGSRLELLLSRGGVTSEAVQELSWRLGIDAALVGPDRQEPASPYDDSLHPEPIPDAFGAPDDALPLAGWSRYELRRLLGAGGMGRVYDAWDPRLRREVAVKLLQSSDREAVDRFIREARSQARVDHDNVCKVFEAGLAQGVPFIAMQLIRGRPLHEAGRDLPLRARLRLVCLCAEAVHAAHRSGLIHRDLKPSNILVEEKEGEEPVPYVLDFGLARVLETTGETMDGQVLGTPAYMAPEQAWGLSHRLDVRTDVYGLGATLYELVSGRPPFAEQSSLKVLLKVVGEEPSPPSTLNPELPRDLETIVLKCLRKEPGERYDSARAVAEDIHRFLAGDPVSAHPPSLSYRWGKWSRKHRLSLAMAALSVTVAMVVGGLAWKSSRDAARRLGFAQEFGQRVERIEGALRRSRTLPLHDVRGDEARVRRLMSEIEADMSRLGTKAMGPGQYALGRAALLLGETEQARQHLEAARRAGYETPAVSYALGRSLAELYVEALEDCRRIYDEELREQRTVLIRRELRDPALALLKSAGRSRDLEAGQVEAFIAFFEERYEDAAVLAREVSVEMPWVYEARALEGRALAAQGRAEIARGEYEDAKAHLDRAQEAYEKAIDVARSDPDLYAADCALASNQLIMSWTSGGTEDGEFETSRIRCVRGLEADPDHAGIWRSLATVLWRRGEFLLDHGGAGRESIILESIEAGRKTVSLDPFNDDALTTLATAWEILGEHRILAGDDPTAELDQAVLNNQAALDINPRNDRALASLGNCRFSRGSYRMGRGLDPRTDFSLAVDAYRKAHEINPLYAWPGNQASILNRAGEYELDAGLDPSSSIREALIEARKALELNPSFGYAWEEQGKSYLVEAEYQLEMGGDARASLSAADQALEAALEIHEERIVPHLLLTWSDVLATRMPDEIDVSRAGHLESAKIHLARAQQLGPENQDVSLSWAEIYLREGELRAPGSKYFRDATDLGLAACEEALRINSGSADARALRGALHLLRVRGARSAAGRKNAAARAAEDLRRALELNPLLQRRFGLLLEEAESVVDLRA